MIADSVVDWLKNHSDSFRAAEQELDELQRVIVEQCESFDEFIGVVHQNLDDIPKELREAADRIRSHAIGAHMARIQSAASSVEGVKSDVDRTAKIAIGAH